jgi:hypothetical protein
MTEDRSLDERTVKHLEFIQAVIARLATDSFFMKGWGLTVAGAFFGFSAKDLDWHLALVGLLPVAAFWVLDAYFLSRERIYREMYEAVRRKDARVGAFSMDYRPFQQEGEWYTGNRNQGNWLFTIPSRTLFVFYTPILLVGIALIVVTSLNLFSSTGGAD